MDDSEGLAGFSQPSSIVWIPGPKGLLPSQQLQKVQVSRKSQGSVVWAGCWLNTTYSQIPTSHRHLRISLQILYTANSCLFNA